MIEESPAVIVSPRQPTMKVTGIAIVIIIAVGVIVLAVGLSIGRSAGYAIGYEEGRLTGYGEGYESGHGAGYDSGQSAGYSSGHYAGRSEGYEKGLEDGRFEFYYVKPPTQKYGVDNLTSFLSGLQWNKPYQEDVFDCSEMSADLERRLENEGWHTIIAAGSDPAGSGAPHAWVLVETSVGKYTPVESTTLTVVQSSSPYFNNYFKYDYSFETIQDALAVNETEFDWWQSG